MAPPNISLSVLTSLWSLVYKKALSPIIGLMFVALISWPLNFWVSGNAKSEYNRWFNNPKLKLEEISSSVARFAREDSTEIKQLLSYKLSAPDIVSEIKLSVLFGRGTRILEHAISYNADLEGYSARLESSHYIHLTLGHALFQDRYAIIFFETSRMVARTADEPMLELPGFEYGGTDENGSGFSLFLPSITRELRP